MADVREIIDRLESYGLLRTHKQVGNYMQIYCPFHNEGQERKPSCGILLVDEFRGGKNYPKGFVHCFTCHYAKPMNQAVRDMLKNHSVDSEAMEWIDANIGEYIGDYDEDSLFPPGAFESMINKYMVDYVQSYGKPKPSYIPEEELAGYRYTVPYMYERKLTDELIEKFDVGYDANWIPPGRKKPVPCITFPVRDRSGNTLFLVRRAIQTKLYNYPEGVTKPLYGLYELPEHCKSVIICESAINALTCWRYGKPAVALLGTGNSYQIQQLRELGVREFILGFDADEAGHKATEKLKKALRNVAIVWVLSGIPEGQDINDLTEEQFNNLSYE